MSPKLNEKRERQAQELTRLEEREREREGRGKKLSNFSSLRALLVKKRKRPDTKGESGRQTSWKHLALRAEQGYGGKKNEEREKMAF